MRGLPFLFFFITVFAFAQYPVFYNLDRQAGLASNEVYQSVQDNDGFIYLGTSSGLFRYDGFTFTQIGNKEINARPVSHLLKSASGKIWCQNFAGQIYQVDHDSLIIIRDYSDRNLVFPQFTVDANEVVWVALKDSLVRIDAAGNERATAYAPHKISQVSSVSEVAGKIYVTDALSGVYEFDASNPASSRQVSDKIRGRVMTASNGGKLLIFAEAYPGRTSQVIELVDGRLAVLLSFGPNELAREIHQVRRFGNDTWVCTSDGAFLFRGTSRVRHILAGNETSSVMIDREGNYWFTTLNTGVMVVPSLSVFKLQAQLMEKEGTNFTALTAREDGTLLFGNLGGDVFVRKPGSSPSLLSGVNSAIYRRANKIITSEGYTYVARGDQLSIYDPKGREQIYPNSYIRDMVKVGDELFLLTSGGINTFDLGKRSVTGSVSVSARVMVADVYHQNLVVSASRGLYIYSKGRLTPFLIENKPVYATSLWADDDLLWIGTLNDGLYGVRDNKLEYHFNQASGLNGSDIRAITAHDDELIVCTEKGIHKLVPSSGQVSFQHASEVDFPGVNSMVVSSDTIYLATRSGLFYLPCGIFTDQGKAPHIAVMQARLNGELISLDSKVELRGNDDLEFYFKAFSYSIQGQVGYQYRTTDKWQDLPGSVDRVKLSALSPGRYTFEVRAKHPAGGVSDSRALPFRVIAPFWQRPWFIVISIIVFWSIAALIFWLRVRTVRRQARINAQLIQSQLTALKAQMNPHFMFNALTSIQDLIVRQDTRKSSHYLSRFAVLLRRILETSEQQSIGLDDELEILQLYLELEKLRFGDEFKYDIILDESVVPSQIRIPSLIIQPFVENGIKHGLLHKKGEKHIRISFRLQEQLICEIEDNGVGRKKSNEIKIRSGQTHQSFATQATERRIELLQRISRKNYQVAIDDLERNGVATGTRVVVMIPL